MRSWLLVLTLALACCVHIASAAAHGDRHSSKERPHASSMSHESSKESDEAAEADLDEDEGAPERPEGGVAIAAPTAPHQANRDEKKIRVCTVLNANSKTTKRRNTTLHNPLMFLLSNKFILSTQMFFSLGQAR
ncbi:hypothetical protein R5R35_008520 [Gryllus longicercus]|uniref:Accessory gland protein n=1 Tax=Gryllus longicercus TaxID=2509291 RepID=A0AAN9Z236_9ORTH